MSNPTISQIKVGDGVVYDLCDSEARNILFPLTQEAGVLKHGTKLETKNYTYVQGATNASLMANKSILNTNAWNPIVGIQTKGGGSWTIGNYNNEGLQFVYLSADRIANNNNTPNTNIIFNADGTSNLISNKVSTISSTATKTTSISSDIITLNTSNTSFYYTWTSDGEKKEWFAVANCAIHGKICSLEFTWKNKNAFTVPVSGNISNFTVGTLPASKRPAIASVGHSTGDYAGAAWYSIATNGVISLCACESTGTSREISANTTFIFRATYILA